MNTMYVADTETNGGEPAEVIELAYARVEKGIALSEMYTQRFEPQTPSNFGALSVHHILPEELGNCSPSAEAKLPADCTHLIGHNIDYDWKALGSPPVKRICTLAIARRLYPQLDSHKLGAMIYFCFGAKSATREFLRDAHAAAADVNFCWEILCRMLLDHGREALLNEPENLWQFSELCRLPTIMTFGKYKGKAIKDLPYDYVSWMLKQPDMDPYVIKAVKQAKGLS